MREVTKEDRAAAVASRHCVECGESVPDDYADMCVNAEYLEMGLCIECQDGTFIQNDDGTIEMPSIGSKRGSSAARSTRPEERSANASYGRRQE
jgi:hypothetical protein